MTDQQGQGDIDPVSQFSDPSLIHSYAENSRSPSPASQPPPSGSLPSPERRSWRGPVLVLLVLAVVLATLLISLTH